jgi:ribosomal protein L6P/L9E
LPNSQAIQKILVPEIRAELKNLYTGSEEGFEYFLIEHFFDLHYKEKTCNQAINLGLGHIWRLAIDHPESEVLPCIHRAPIEKNGQKRLLLIC